MVLRCGGPGVTAAGPPSARLSWPHSSKIAAYVRQWQDLGPVSRAARDVAGWGGAGAGLLRRAARPGGAGEARRACEEWRGVVRTTRRAAAASRRRGALPGGG